MDPITDFVAGTASSGPAEIGRVTSTAASTRDPGRLVIATTDAPSSFARAAERTRSPLAPDCEITRTPELSRRTPEPSENTEGGMDVAGIPVSRIIS